MKIKGSVLVLESVSKHDEADYTCIAMNDFGYIEHTITVEVSGELSTNSGSD